MATNPTLESLQQQLAQMQQQMKAVQPVPQVKQVSQADIDALVKQAIAKQLDTKVEPVQELPKLTILQAIGSSLSEDEQLWFSDIKNLQGLSEFLPEFLITEESVAFIKALVKAYRK